MEQRLVCLHKIHPHESSVISGFMYLKRRKNLTISQTTHIKNHSYAHPQPTFSVLSTFFFKKKQYLLATGPYWLSPVHSPYFQRSKQLLCIKIEVDLAFQKSKWQWFKWDSTPFLPRVQQKRVVQGWQGISILLAMQALFTLFLRYSQHHTLPSHDPRSLLQLLPPHPPCSQQEGEKGTRGHTFSLKVMAWASHVKLPPASHWLEPSHTSMPSGKRA